MVLVALISGAVGCGPSGPDAALNRAIGYFETRQGPADPSWRGLFVYYQRRFGLEIGSDGGGPLHELQAPPGRPPAERVYDRLWDPEASVPAVWIAELPTAVDRLVANALHCDRVAIPANWTRILEEASKTGGYALTHAVLAAEWSVENGCIHESSTRAVNWLQVDLLLDLLGRREALAGEFKNSDDLWIEALAMLYYAGAGSQVRSEWIETLLELQRTDGGFAARPGSDHSDPHATALALWVLLEQREPPSPRVRWLPPRS